MAVDNNYWRTFWQRRLSRRRVIQGAALGSAGLAAAAVIGCEEKEDSTSSTPGGSPGAASEQPVRGGVITHLNESSDAPHIDPQLQSFASLHDSGPAIAYSRLLMFDLDKYPNEITFTSNLAESYENPDDQTYIFRLQKGVKFHNISPVNGREVVASDVVYSLRRQIEGGVNRGVLAAVDKIEEVDPYSVRLTLKKPDADFLLAAADMRGKVVASEAVEVSGDLKNGPTIGTGPWILEEWVPEQTLKMRRNPEYFMQGLPYADFYERVVILDPQTAQAAFRAGQVSNIGTNGQITRVLRQSVPDLDVKDAKLLQAVSQRAMLLSPLKPPLNDKRVRQALNKLIDREAIIRDAYFGSGWNQAGMYLPSFDWHLPETELNRLIGRDIQTAKQMLSAAGVDFSTWKPAMDLGIPTGDFQQVGELMVSNFKEAGLEISDVRLVDKVEVTERGWIRAEPEVCVCNTRPGGGGTNGVLYTWYHTSGSDSGYWKQLADKEMDTMIDQQAVIVNDPERRKGLLLEIQRRIIDQGVHNQLPTTNAEVAIHPRLQNYKQMGNSEPERFSISWIKA